MVVLKVYRFRFYIFLNLINVNFILLINPIGVDFPFLNLIDVNVLCTLKRYRFPFYIHLSYLSKFILEKFIKKNQYGVKVGMVFQISTTLKYFGHK